MEDESQCLECQKVYVPSKRGTKQLFCSTKCRMRAYRKRASSRVGELSSCDRKIIATLEKEVARLQQELKETRKLSFLFPIQVTSGNSIPIKSAEVLVPGVIIRSNPEGPARVILQKEERMLIVQRLDTMEIGSISIYDVKSGWLMDPCVKLVGLARTWQEMRNVTN